eukprot:4298187-Amphidinium_carterae.1
MGRRVLVLLRIKTARKKPDGSAEAEPSSCLSPFPVWVEPAREAGRGRYPLPSSSPPGAPSRACVPDWK